MTRRYNDYCAFCRSLLTGTSGAPWDTILKETERFVVSPTKGSLLPGWLLVVAKRHAICSGALTTNELKELQNTIAMAKEIVRENFGPPTVFEHGPSCAGTALGCGIDHQHVHVVPLHFSLTRAVNALEPYIQWETLSEISGTKPLHRAGIAYALVQEDGGPMLWCRPPDGVRQMFRQAIAHGMGIPQEYDYAEFPQLPNTVRTLEHLSRQPS